MIYLDNAASSGFKPDNVINSIKNTLKYISANPGRSAHGRALCAARLIGKTRALVSEYFNGFCDDNVIFTSGCTMSLNLAVIGTAIRGGTVVTTALEHNSVLRPLYELRQKGIINLVITSPDGQGAVTAKEINDALTPDTYLVAISHISNVTGVMNPIEEIGALCRKKKILFLVDAAQSAGHVPIDCRTSHIDMLAISAHKGLHGPQGAGALLFDGGAVRLHPIIYGGTGTSSDEIAQPEDSPEAFESGTLNTPGIAGLNAGIRYVAENARHIEKTVDNITGIIYDGLSAIKNLTLFSPRKSPSGIVTFAVKDITSSTVGDILNSKYDIAVRSGLHCAPLIHRHLCTLETGLVRASVGPDNTAYEAYRFIKAVNEICKQG
jgi:cysteine desulfurase family protein